jgi:hypothetical protein
MKVRMKKPNSVKSMVALALSISSDFTLLGFYIQTENYQECTFLNIIWCNDKF